MNDYYELWNRLKEYVRYLDEDAFALAEDEAGWALKAILDKFDELEGVGKYASDWWDD